MSGIGRDAYKRPRTISAVSPFRYPGGKGFLAPFLAQHMAEIGVPMTVFAEPFAGGAGSALRLLKDGLVESLILNDLDIRVYSAWRAMLRENERFQERLSTIEPDLATWNACRETVERASSEYSFELGFATFFINRTSRAGIIVGSGPIGGYNQDGKWRLDARFYKDTMLKRIDWLGKNSSRIEITHRNALEFLEWSVKHYSVNSTFYFIDPPYVAAGSRLYFNSMEEADHRALASRLHSGDVKHWLLTYDRSDLVADLYENSDLYQLEVPYSLGTSRNEREFLVASNAIGI
ncbi:DNA adenine methylase [Thalassococcus profundi]|uniref:DNA adenine methylase n=1 Tax=Thalassococcus profundi TaxID=2282382 RepID=UPI0018F23690|nr:DNA adenine methylase [Thalassococcus profundi]